MKNKFKVGDKIMLVDGYKDVPPLSNMSNSNSYVDAIGCVPGEVYTVTEEHTSGLYVRLGMGQDYWVNNTQFKLAADAATMSKEDTMKSVEQVTYINGTDASTMSLDQYLTVLGQRQKQIDTLKKSAAADSAAVKKQIAKLDDDVAAITALMDEYHG